MNTPRGNLLGKEAVDCFLRMKVYGSSKQCIDNSFARERNVEPLKAWMDYFVIRFECW